MSADNWAVCPKCLREAQDAYDDEALALRALYGAIPVEEFDARRAALSPPDPETFRTFREDYEFYGASTGEVTASYSGRCSVCGVGTDFKELRRFWEPSRSPTEEGGISPAGNPRYGGPNDD